MSITALRNAQQGGIFHIMVSIKDAREALGMTQREFAAQVGVSVLTISRAERGHYPRAATRQRMASVLGVSVRDLFVLALDAHPLVLEREIRGLTQIDLANLAKVALRTICNIEHGHSKARYYIRRRLLKALDIPFSEHQRVFPVRGSL